MHGLHDVEREAQRGRARAAARPSEASTVRGSLVHCNSTTTRVAHLWCKIHAPPRLVHGHVAILEREDSCADLAVGNGSVTETSDAVSVEADNGFSKSIFAATASLSTAAQSAAYSSSLAAGLASALRHPPPPKSQPGPLYLGGRAYGTPPATRCLPVPLPWRRRRADLLRIRADRSDAPGGRLQRISFLRTGLLD